jgi:hypothetical protein
MRMCADLSLLYGDGRPILRPMLRTILNTFRLHQAPDNAGNVHFHQGPQGDPAPCFDERCPNPKLSV